jgi:hypothetical protein
VQHRVLSIATPLTTQETQELVRVVGQCSGYAYKAWSVI